MGESVWYLYVQADKPHKAHLECDGVDEMSIAEIKMYIAEIDAKLQEKAECGGVMPPCAS